MAHDGFEGGGVDGVFALREELSAAAELGEGAGCVGGVGEDGDELGGGAAVSLRGVC